MAPIKFEDNIREKLQDRELNPSKDAWKKLAATLEEAPEKPSSKRLWMALAASVIGLMLIISYFIVSEEAPLDVNLVEEETVAPNLNSDTENNLIKENTMVTPEENEVAENDDTVPQNLDAESPAIDKINTKQEPVIAVAKNNDRKDRNEILDGINENMENTEVTQRVVLGDPLKRKEGDLLLTKDSLLIDQTVEAVVAEVKLLEKNNHSVTAEEIDNLLRIAQRDIANRRILNSNTQKIDATALLNDVETELERSFRDKVFDALGKGYHKVRTAVAERNY